MTEEHKKVTPQEYWQGFPEAPASDTVKWVDKDGFEHMTTLRAWTGDGLYQQIAKFVANVKDTGGRTTVPVHAPAPVAPAAPSAVAETGTMSLRIGKIKVTPEVKDGKPRIMVELFAGSHQYADIKKFFDNNSQASAAFAAVTSLDFSIAGEYTVDFIADYRNSEKMNTKGNPYKNLVNVREP